MKVEKKISFSAPINEGELVASTAKVKVQCEKKHGKIEVKALKVIAWANDNKKATVTVTEKKGGQKISYSKAYKKLPEPLKVQEATIKKFTAEFKQTLMDLVRAKSGKKGAKAE